MRLITRAETVGVLGIQEAAQIVRETYLAIGDGRVVSSHPSCMPFGAGTDGHVGRFRVKGAVLYHLGVAGVRLNAPGHPRLMLWDLASGEPTAFIEEERLYPLRTGVSAAVVGAWLVPRPNPVIALIGAGEIAEQMAIAFDVLLSPAELRIAARTEGSARRLVDNLAARDPAPIVARAASSIEHAVKGADLVVTITTANAPIVLADWIDTGATVLSMGGGNEFDFEVWRRASHRVIDDLDYAFMQGDVASWIASGDLDRATAEQGLSLHVSALAAGRWAGRRRTDDFVLAIIQGVTALDLALAHRVVQRISAKETT